MTGSLPWPAYFTEVGPQKSGFLLHMNEPSSQSSCLSVSFEVKYWEYNTHMPLSQSSMLLAGLLRRVIIIDGAAGLNNWTPAEIDVLKTLFDFLIYSYYL